MNEENIVDLSDSSGMSSGEFPEDTKNKRANKARFYVRAFLGISVVAGLIYLSGIQQALFYGRTSPEISQTQTESLLDAETITIPLKIFIFRNNENFGSERTKYEIRRMVDNTSLIWNQADIDFEIKKFVLLKESDDEIGKFLDYPRTFVMGLDDYDQESINVFLSMTLKGLKNVNGIAFTDIRTVAVADLTTVYDFRVLAHEIGHVLGLGHVDDSSGRLMYRGANGFDLTEEEILRARKFASEFVIK